MCRRVFARASTRSTGEWAGRRRMTSRATATRTAVSSRPVLLGLLVALPARISACGWSINPGVLGGWQQGVECTLEGDDRNRTGVDGFAGNDSGVRIALYPVVRVAQFF